MKKRLRPSQGGKFHDPVGPSADLATLVRGLDPSVESLLTSQGFPASEFWKKANGFPTHVTEAEVHAGLDIALAVAKRELAEHDAQVREETKAALEASTPFPTMISTWKPTEAELESLRAAFAAADEDQVGVTIPPRQQYAADDGVIYDEDADLDGPMPAPTNPHLPSKWSDFDLTGVPRTPTKPKPTPDTDRFNPVYDDLARGAVSEDWIPKDPKFQNRMIRPMFEINAETFGRPVDHAIPGRSALLAPLDKTFEFRLWDQALRPCEVAPSAIMPGDIFAYRRRMNDESEHWVQHKGGCLWKASDDPNKRAIAFNSEGEVSHITAFPFTPPTGVWGFNPSQPTMYTPGLPGSSTKDFGPEDWELLKMLGLRS